MGDSICVNADVNMGVPPGYGKQGVTNTPIRKLEATAFSKQSRIYNIPLVVFRNSERFYIEFEPTLAPSNTINVPGDLRQTVANMPASLMDDLPIFRETSMYVSSGID